MGIRKAKLNDWEDLKRLTEELRNYGSFDVTMDKTMSDKNDEFYKDAASNKNGYYTLVYEREDEIHGCAICELVDAEADRKLEKHVKVHHIFLGEYARGRQIGERMFNKIEKWALKQGVFEVSIIASAQNTMALEFYHKLGYKDYDVILNKHLDSSCELK